MKLFNLVFSGLVLCGSQVMASDTTNEPNPFQIQQQNQGESDRFKTPGQNPIPEQPEQRPLERFYTPGQGQPPRQTRPDEPRVRPDQPTIRPDQPMIRPDNPIVRPEKPEQPQQRNLAGFHPARPGRYTSESWGMDYEVLPTGRIRVLDVKRNGAADISHLDDDDCIFYIDGVDVADLDIQELEINRYVKLTVYNFDDRNWREVSFLPTKNGRRAIVGNPTMIIDDLGIGIEGTPMQTYRVLDVSPSSVAARLGLKPGDVVFNVNGKNLWQLDGAAGPFDKSFTMKVRRRETTMTLSSGIRIP